MASSIRIIEGDITQLSVEAIVNAANSRLLGGSGVDGAIHAAAGPGLVDECRKIKEIRPGVRCPPGEARLTGGHNLPAKYVIHTVGPIWEGGGQGEDRILASCYRSCLSLAAQKGIRSIAFPAIGTGVYGFPMDRCARIAIREVNAFAKKRPDIEVNLVCYGFEALRVFQTALLEAKP